MGHSDHSLDQLLENFLNVGISPSAITRLGSSGNDRTRSLDLSKQKSFYKRPERLWDHINELEEEETKYKTDLDVSFDAYQNLTASPNVMRYLKLMEPEFYDAFAMAESNESGIADMGSEGIRKYYLYYRWIEGHDAGIYANTLSAAHHDIWRMGENEREAKWQSWKKALLDESAKAVSSHTTRLNQCREDLKTSWGDKIRHILRSRRIIGCTPTTAALYSQDLRTISPGIAIIADAGQILEPHVLAGLPQEIKQLVLIGDHMQLRPKINNYALSVEKGNGYDLNVSLFESLIRMDYPHTTLLTQHHMSPKISALVRNLCYPDLEDDRKTEHHPPPRGLQDRVIFLQHEHEEATLADVYEKRDEGAKQSKHNVWEAEIIMQIVQYLGQQGYTTDELVVLTPYRGQLLLLRDMLSKHNNPVLNDLDYQDLLKAGYISSATLSYGKRNIKLSTIGTYCNIMLREESGSNPGDR